ncbi:hypothetical protein BHE74_00028306 [Ensete ventricosum]|nr:hypothetical protein GW17_00024396 [Ensete ventricosum]RWW64455.1 hypothetical protein BHE74_00028306 [Ensete ventricosum]RZS04671.1 hypothetical protein BHM03_00035033 [Ensete ventricosum]
MQVSPELGRSLLSRLYHLRQYLCSGLDGWQGAAQDLTHFKPKEIIRLKHWNEIGQANSQHKTNEWPTRDLY